MSDEVDRASREEARAIEINIANSKIREPNLKHKGTCYYCGETVPSPKLFCDSDCKVDHEWLTKKR